MAVNSKGKSGDKTSGSDYLSKSRLKTWINCPRSFYYKYVEEIDTPETEAMVRGTDIHAIIEDYYENAIEDNNKNGEIPDILFELFEPEEYDDWDKYVSPYITNFIGFERRRLENADRNLDDWLPRGIEEKAEKNLLGQNIPISMGYADALLPAASFNPHYITENEGEVMVDFKTGDDKSDKYRSVEHGGVELDLTFYKMLFEDEFNIVAVAAYYPKTDTLFTSKITDEQREFVEERMEEISQANPTNIEDYPTKETPLCAWGEGENNRCEFYEQCESTWAVPIDEKEKTIELIKNHLPKELENGEEKEAKQKIADELGTSVDALEYWINKKRLYRYRK